jgi:hypothetical protein
MQDSILFLFPFKNFFSDRDHFAFFQLPEKTAPITGVAGGDVLFDLEQQAIGVAIVKHFPDLLGVAAGLALDPKFLPGA